MDVKRILENYEENLLILQNYLAGQNQFGLGDLSPIKDKPSESRSDLTELTNNINTLIQKIINIKNKKPKTGSQSPSRDIGIKQSLMRNFLESAKRTQDRIKITQEEMELVSRSHETSGKGFEFYIDWIKAMKNPVALQRQNEERKGSMLKTDSIRRRSTYLMQPGGFGEGGDSETSDLTKYCQRNLKYGAATLEELAAVRMATLEAKVPPELTEEYEKAKHTIGILLSDYMSKIAELDHELMTSFKENDDINEKIDNFMQDIRERKVHEKLFVQRYQHLSQLMQKNSEYYQEEIDALRRRIDEERREKVKAAKAAADNRKIQELKLSKEQEQKRYEEEMEKLRDQLSSDAQAAVDKISLERSEAVSKVKKLEGELSGLRSRNNQLNRTLNELETKINNFLEDNNYSYKGSKRGIDLLVSEFERIEKRLEEKLELEEDYENLKKQYQQILNKKNRYEDGYQSTKEELEQTQQELAQLKQKFITYRGESVETIDRLSRENAELTKRSSRLEESNKIYVEKDQQDTEKIDELQLLNDQLKIKNEYLSAMIKVSKDQKEEPTMVSQMDSVNLALTLTNKDKDKELEYLKKKLINLRQENRTLRRKVESLQRELERGAKAQGAESNQNKPHNIPKAPASEKGETKRKDHLDELNDLRGLHTDLEARYERLSGQLWKLERENKGLRQINSQLRESYEKSTGNRNLTPIPSYATVADKEQHLSSKSIRKKDSFEGFEDDSDDEQCDVYQINDKLNADILALKKEREQAFDLMQKFRAENNLLRKNSKSQKERVEELVRQRKDAEERLNNFIKQREFEIENSPVCIGVGVQTEKSGWQVRSEDLETEIEQLRMKLDGLRAELEESSQELKNLGEGREQLLEVIGKLGDEKNYLVQLLKRFGETVRVKGRHVSGIGEEELKGMVQEIAELRRRSLYQGKLYEVVRYVDSGVSEEEPEERKLFANEMSTEPLDEIQELNKQKFDLEGKLDTMLENEDRIIGALIPILELLSSKQNQKPEIKQKADNLLKSFALKIDDSSSLTDNQTASRILEGVELAHKFIQDGEKRVKQLISAQVDKNEATEMRSQADRKLILELVRRNREYQSQLDVLVGGYCDDIGAEEKGSDFEVELSALLKKK